MAAQQESGSQDDHDMPEAIEFLPWSRKPECRHSSAPALW